MATKRGGSGTGSFSISHSTVDTGGGDIAGRDNIRRGTVQYASARQLDEIFYPVAQAIEQGGVAGKADAEQKLAALKHESAKGRTANDSVMAKLVEGIVGLVPSAVSAVVGAFAAPILGGIAGPATKYVLDKIQGK